MYTYLVSIPIQIKKILSLAGIFTLDLWGTKPMCYQLSYPGLGSSKKSYNSAFRHFIDIHPSQEVKEEKENDFFSKMGQKMIKQDWIVFKIYYQIIFTKIIIVPIQSWLEH